MAAKVADSAMEEIANSLTEAEQVPTKLRCAICDKVAINAFKLPCCDQNMCGNCQSSLPESCPICQHSPLNAEDAKPSKSLRLTVTQFLKQIKKKREKAATTAPAGDVTPTPAPEPITPVVEAIPAAIVDATLEPSETLAVPVDSVESPLPQTLPAELDPKSEVEVTKERVAEEEAELQNIEATTKSHESNENAQEQSAEADDEDDAESDTSEFEIITGDEDKTAANPWGELPEEDEEAQQGGLDPNWAGYSGQNQMGGQYDMQGNPNNFGMYPNAGSNDVMQYMMQQMGMSQQMLNMMPGMQGMNFNNMSQMDMMTQMAAFQQMQMQSMGGYGDMGNMGYNMNGNFGGANGWNNQNMNNGADFGASSGYYSQDGGYNNQGNYPNNVSSNHRQFSKNDSYRDQPRERGSFRGSQRGFGKGNYRDERPAHGRTFSNTGPPVVSEGPPLNAPTGPKARREPPVDTYHPGSKAGSDRLQASPTNEGASRDTTNTNEQEVGSNAREIELELRPQRSSKDEQPEKHRDVEVDVPLENGHDHEKQTNGTPTESYFDQRSQRGSFRGRGRGSEARGGWRGREGWHTQGSRADVPASPVSTEPAGLGVPNAPSGPKAMREGAPRGRGGLHGRIHSQSFSSARQEEYAQPNTPANNTPAHDSFSTINHRPRSRDRSVRDRSKSPERRQSTRHRSRTPSDSDYERKKERRRRRKHEEEIDNRHEEQIVDDGNEDKYRSSRRENERHRSSKSKRDTSRERRKEKRRSRSPPAVHEEELQTNGHHEDSKEKNRSRRDKDKYRERSRDRDRHREKDRDRERDKKRSSRRDRSASPDSKHRSSHRRDKEQEKEKERDKESRRASAASVTKTRSVYIAPKLQKQLEAGFRIHGRSKEKERDKQKAEASVVVETPAPPTPVEIPVNDSAKMAPPTGPRADRSSGAPSKFKLDLANLNTRSTPTSSRRASQSATPTSAKPAKPTAPVDPYEEERRKAQEARIAKENSRRAGAPALTKKRSWADVAEEEPAPRTSERERKKVKGRKISYRYEDELEDEDVRYR